MSTFALVGLGSLIFSSSVQADTVDDLKAKQSEVKDERSEIKKDLSKAESKVADVLIDLEELNEEIDSLEEELVYNKEMMEKAENQIVKFEEDIAIIEERVAELEENIAERFETLKQRATSYQKTGGNVGYMEVLFGAKSFNDFISRVSAVMKITDSDTELINQQEVDKTEVKKHQAEIEEKLIEQKEAQLELEGMKDLIVEQQAENKENQKVLKKKEAKLNKLVAELEDEDSSLATIEAEVNRNIDRLRSPVASNSNPKTVSNNNPIVGGGGNFNSAIEAGFSQRGAPYVGAGKGPGGFDCSGFVSWAYGEAGYSIPSNTGQLSGIGQSVPYSQAQPGDLIFFDTTGGPGSNGHVGIYLGNGQFLGSQSSTGVAVASLSNSYWSRTFNGHVRRIN